MFATICDGKSNCCETNNPLKNPGADKERNYIDTYKNVPQLGQCAAVIYNCSKYYGVTIGGYLPI